MFKKGFLIAVSGDVKQLVTHVSSTYNSITDEQIVEFINDVVIIDGIESKRTILNFAMPLSSKLNEDVLRIAIYKYLGQLYLLFNESRSTKNCLDNLGKLLKYQNIDKGFFDNYLKKKSSKNELSNNFLSEQQQPQQQKKNIVDVVFKGCTDFVDKFNSAIFNYNWKVYKLNRDRSGIMKTLVPLFREFWFIKWLDKKFGNYRTQMSSQTNNISLVELLFKKFSATSIKGLVQKHVANYSTNVKGDMFVTIYDLFKSSDSQLKLISDPFFGVDGLKRIQNERINSLSSNSFYSTMVDSHEAQPSLSTLKYLVSFVFSEQFYTSFKSTLKWLQTVGIDLTNYRALNYFVTVGHKNIYRKAFKNVLRMFLRVSDKVTIGQHNNKFLKYDKAETIALKKYINTVKDFMDNYTPHRDTYDLNDFGSVYKNRNSSTLELYNSIWTKKVPPISMFMWDDDSKRGKKKKKPKKKVPFEQLSISEKQNEVFGDW